jgi:hypothetical protein
MTFGIGDIVVCVEEFDQPKEPGERYPVVGGIYTIRGVEFPDDAACGLLFEEIVNPPHDYEQGFVECWFDSEYFRRVIKTDISTLEAMLSPIQKVKEPTP